LLSDGSYFEILAKTKIQTTFEISI